MGTTQKPLVRSPASKELTVTVEHDTRTVEIYVPRRTRGTTDEEFAEMIERMSRARTEWLGRGYRVRFVK